MPVRQPASDDEGTERQAATRELGGGRRGASERPRGRTEGAGVKVSGRWRRPPGVQGAARSLGGMKEGILEIAYIVVQSPHVRHYVVGS